MDDRAVGVPEHDDILPIPRQHRFGIRPSCFVSMAHVNRYAPERQHPLPRERRIVRIVDVPVDGLGRRNLRERLEHARSTDVAGVQNELDVGERRRDFRPHEAVGIGDEADDDVVQ